MKSSLKSAKVSFFQMGVSVFLTFKRVALLVQSAFLWFFFVFCIFHYSTWMLASMQWRAIRAWRHSIKKSILLSSLLNHHHHHHNHHHQHQHQHHFVTRTATNHLTAALANRFPLLSNRSLWSNTCREQILSTWRTWNQLGMKGIC